MKEKQCFKCNTVKPLTDFYRHPDMPDGRVNKCKECNKKDVRANYSVNKEAKREYDRKRHRFSISRIIDHRYNGLKLRSEGRGCRKYKVSGKPYATKEEFLEWFNVPQNHRKFMSIYKKWVKSGFENRLSPSIDRIDPDRGYTVDNMQWLTKSDNCSKYDKKNWTPK